MNFQELTYDTHRLLATELKQLLCCSTALHGKELRWDDLPILSPALHEWDADTLRPLVHLLAEAGFLEGFADHGDTFTYRRADNKLLLPGAARTPTWRKRMIAPLWKQLLAFAVILGVLHLVRLGFTALVLSMLA